MSARVTFIIATLLSILLPHCHCARACDDCVHTPDAAIATTSSGSDCCHHQHGLASEPASNDAADHHSCHCLPWHDFALALSNERAVEHTPALKLLSHSAAAVQDLVFVRTQEFERTRSEHSRPRAVQKNLCRWTC